MMRSFEKTLHSAEKEPQMGHILISFTCAGAKSVLLGIRTQVFMLQKTTSNFLRFWKKQFVGFFQNRVENPKKANIPKKPISDHLVEY